MNNRITYIILFLFAFIFQLNAQLQYVDYEYVDGTKESVPCTFGASDNQEMLNIRPKNFRELRRGIMRQSNIERGNNDV